MTAVFAPDAQGWVQGARVVRSPNCDERPPGFAPTLLVIHNISLPPGRFGTGDIERLFTNTLDPDADPYFAHLDGLRVSAHFLIGRDGNLTQFVSIHDRAWHAGQSEFKGRTRCNDFSLGIELEGTDTTPFSASQYLTLAALCRSLCAAHPIEALAGHSDIAPGRKTDPGPCFDWSALRTASGLPACRFPFQS